MKKLNKAFAVGLVALGVLAGSEIASASPFHRDRFFVKVAPVAVEYHRDLVFRPAPVVCAEPVRTVEVARPFREARFDRRWDHRR